ncbi:MAG: FHA domain-containing protein [Myxococcota bacterium]
MAVVFAKQNDGPAEALITALEAQGAGIVRRKVSGVPARTFADELDPEVRDADRVVVVMSPWLQASDWLFSQECYAILERSNALLVWSFAPCRYGGSPVAEAPRVGDESESPEQVAARVKVALDTGAAPPSAPLEDRPAYGSPSFAVLAERLEGLHAIKATTSGVRGVNAAIKRTASSLRAGPTLSAGEALGSGLYRLLEHVGHGPLASVWRARDRESGEIVAVKVLHAQFVQDAAALARFFETAHALSGLEHPAVARIVDPGGTDQGFPFFVRAYYTGGSLEDAVSTSEFGVAHAIQAVLDVARALEHAHAQGTLHRNVKPSNVLFDAHGAAVLADFSPPHDGSEGSDTLFVAPESQDPSLPSTAAVDVYSLAMTTLFALHGRSLPFWVLRDPERLIKGLPVGDAVKDALRRAVDWDPSARTPSVAAFVEGMLSDAELVRVLGEHAVQSGRFAVAAEHLADLLARSTERTPGLLLHLGRTLTSAGDDAQAADVFREVLRDGDADSRGIAIDELREITERSGDWRGFSDTLRERALASTPPLVPLLVRSARVRTTIAARPEATADDETAAATAWQLVLEHHVHRDQAEEALRFLVQRAEAAEDWPIFVQFGREAWGFAPPSERGSLAYALGVACMDALSDHQGALLWLQRAADAEHKAADLAERLERIRSARGEWRQVVALMLERAEGLEDEEASVDLLLRAAQVALYAHNHHEDAAAILLRVLLRDPEHREALRFLARHHARAGRDDRALALYARLAPHEERGREGESVEVRVADNVDYASLLLRNDRPRGAQLCLEAALDLNPAHLPTLRLASQLSYDLGKWEEARVAFRGLVRAHESSTREPALVRALVRLGDLAWLEGDLSSAATHYNEALELDPDDIPAWWGKAKVAIAGNLGTLAEELASDKPWLVAAPVRLTPHEALARLLAALLHPPAIESWFKLDPMGPEVLALMKRTAPLVLACAAVDLMCARELVRAELFKRLGDAFPAWADPIEAVRRLWFDGPVEHAFPVSASYRWSVPSIDFDPTHHRDVLPYAPPLAPDAPVSVRPSLATLHHASAWKKLLRRPSPVDDPPAPLDSEPIDPPEKSRSALLVFDPGTTEQRVVRVEDSMSIGAGGNDDVMVPITGLQAGHLSVERVGNRYYLTANGPVRYAHGELRSLRMRGGERFELGEIPVEFLVFDADDPPDIAGGLPVSRPQVVPKALEDDDLAFEIDEPPTRTAKAAIFYTRDGSEHIIPIASDILCLWEEEGELRSEKDEVPGFSVKIRHRDGFFSVLERDEGMLLDDQTEPEEREIRHGEELVIGTHLLQFRLLHRANERPAVEDIAALWGAPEGAPILIYDDGTRHGRPIALTSDLFTVGRGRTTDFQISIDSSLSRVHCRIERRNGRMWVSDAGSSNGTQVNGTTIEEAHALQDGDVINIGQSRLEFRSGDGTPSFPSMISLHDLGAEEPTEVLPVGEMSKKALPLDEGLDKIRIANKVLAIVLEELDTAEGSGRGVAELRIMLEARPRTYQQLLDGVEVKENALPGLEVMYNLAQRPDQEQRPLLNFVLGDLIDRAVEQVCEILPDDVVDGMLSRVAEIRYREFLRF